MQRGFHAVSLWMGGNFFALPGGILSFGAARNEKPVLTEEDLARAMEKEVRRASGCM